MKYQVIDDVKHNGILYKKGEVIDLQGKVSSPALKLIIDVEQKVTQEDKINTIKATKPARNTKNEKQKGKK